MKKQVQIMIILIVIVSVLTAGCTGKSSRKSPESGAYEVSDSYMMNYDEDIIMDYAYAAEDSGLANSKAVPAYANDSNQEQKRMIQKSASIKIQVMDPLDAAEKLITLAEQSGGFVVSSSTSQDYYNGDIYLPKANLTIRVPAEKLNDTLAFIESLTSDPAKYVSNKMIHGVDITSDYVDTNSRLTSLEKTLTKLYEILETAENAEEALEVYNEIARVESDIEVYKGQIKYMEESVALSSIDVVIASIRPAPIQTFSSWNIGDVIKDAFESLLDGGKSVIEAIIYFIIVVIPILILIAIPVVLVIFIIRKVIRDRKAKGGNVKKDADQEKNDPLTEIKKN